MVTTDDILRMQSAGMNQDQIVSQLRAKGVSEQEIANIFSQSQIKQGVGGNSQNFSGQGFPLEINQANPIPPNQFPGGPPVVPQPGEPPIGQNMLQGGYPYGGQFGGEIPQPGDPYVGRFGSSAGQEDYGAYSAQLGVPYSNPEMEGSGEYSGMSPSMMSYQGGEMEKVGGEYAGQGTVQDPYGAEAYPMYQPYQEAMSSDIITEISEQVVNERLSALHDKIEKIIDMRTVVEANINNLSDRLKRMENIVDQMQVSILKKIGEYLTDVQDVKKELEETQKSFVAIQKSGKKRGKK